MRILYGVQGTGHGHISRARVILSKLREFAEVDVLISGYNFHMNLEGKINGLYEQGILTQKQSNILHELRFFGNRAVHELAVPSKDSLKMAMEILEQIIFNIYELSAKTEKLKSQIDRE